MYGEYLEYVPLDEDEILKRVPQEKIIEMAIGFEPVPYQKIVNPLKKGDRFPGAYFEWFNGKLWFIDFGDQPTHRVPLRFIRDYFNLTYGDALKWVNTKFNLGLGENSTIVEPKPIIYHSPQVPDVKKQQANIIYQPRPFGQNIDARYWSQFGIHKNHLIEDEVAAAIWYKVYSNKFQKWIVVRPKDPMYAFTEFHTKVKLYRPMATNPLHKWCSNCDENDIGNLKSLPATGRRLFIKKSYKDHRIVRNTLGHDSVLWFQNEGCVPSEKTIVDLVGRFREIYIFFDNDASGIFQAKKLTDIFNGYYPDKTKSLWLPESLKDKGIKDPGELVSKRSQSEMLRFFQEKDLYGDNS